MLTLSFARSAVTDKRRSVIIFKGNRALGTGGATSALTHLTKRDRRGTSWAKSGTRSHSCVHSRPACMRKNTQGCPRSLRHLEQMPRAVLTAGYTCLVRCSVSSLERGSALRLTKDSHLSPFLQTGHLLVWILYKPRPFLFYPHGLKTYIYLQAEGFNSIKLNRNTQKTFYGMDIF